MGGSLIIILLERDRLKIRLDKDEARKFGLNMGYVNHPSDEIREALVSLLRKACIEAGFQPGDSKLIAQILPGEDGGCVVYFTIMRGLRITSGGFTIEPVVFAFRSALGMVRAVRDLYRSYGQRIYKSSLYTNGGGYHLMVRTLDYENRQSARFLEEYAHRVGSGEMLAAYIDEHYELLIDGNAIDIIGRNTATFGDWVDSS